ncbi:MAG: RNA pyrophosphohydrolase [Alphaproteobacteria bacterium]|mgnify:CR=1 FL=1
MSGPGGPAPTYRLGVGVMLMNMAGLVFVARRNDMPGDHWQMPQGGIDGGEAPRDAALRELKEEIGTDRAAILGEARRWFSYDLPPDLARTAWGGRYRGQRQKWFAARFLGDDREIDLETEHPEFTEWRWIEATALPDLIVPFKRQLYLDVIEEFRALLPDNP